MKIMSSLYWLIKSWTKSLLWENIIIQVYANITPFFSWNKVSVHIKLL